MQPQTNFTQAPLLASWQLRHSKIILLASCFLGLLYPVFGDGFSSIVPFINGLIIGFFGGTVICMVEFVVFKSRRKRTGFIPLLITKASLYTGIFTFFVFFVILVSRSIQYRSPLLVTWKSEAFHHFLFNGEFIIILCYALALVIVVIFTQEMSRKMGQGVLLNFILGRYSSPVREHRIFMFLDLNSSISITETLGDFGYHNLLNDFFSDITTCILKANGKIYQYVGDEIVVSWPMTKSIRPEACLNVFFDCERKIRSVQDHYRKHYGFVPQFKAAFHCGEVICGEIGQVKSDIVFHGDVINTTARIERLCSELNESILISGSFYNMFSNSTSLNFHSVGKVKLRGKEKELDIFGWRWNEAHQEANNVVALKQAQ